MLLLTVVIVDEIVVGAAYSALLNNASLLGCAAHCIEHFDSS